MYNSRIFCLILILTFGISMIFQAAEAVDEVTLSTSSDIYYDGDHVVVFGSVSTFFENLPITIQIYHETNLLVLTKFLLQKMERLFQVSMLRDLNGKMKALIRIGGSILQLKSEKQHLSFLAKLLTKALRFFRLTFQIQELLM